MSVTGAAPHPSTPRGPLRRSCVRRGLALAAAAAAALTLTPSAAHASRDPGGGCPTGFSAVSLDTTFVGSAWGGAGGGRGGGTGPALRHHELVVLGCIQHRGSSATMQLSWGAVGKLYTGIFIYQLYNCGTRKVEANKTLEYPTGGPSYGSGAATVPASAGARYALRIIGDGAYERPKEPLAGAIGYFRMRPPGGLPPFVGFSPCV